MNTPHAAEFSEKINDFIGSDVMSVTPLESIDEDGNTATPTPPGRHDWKGPRLNKLGNGRIVRLETPDMMRRSKAEKAAAEKQAAADRAADLQKVRGEAANAVIVDEVDTANQPKEIASNTFMLGENLTRGGQFEVLEAVIPPQFKRVKRLHADFVHSAGRPIFYTSIGTFFGPVVTHASPNYDIKTDTRSFKTEKIRFSVPFTIFNIKMVDLRRNQIADLRTPMTPVVVTEGNELAFDLVFNQCLEPATPVTLTARQKAKNTGLYDPKTYRPGLFNKSRDVRRVRKLAEVT